MLDLAIAIDYSSGLPLVVCAGVAMYIASKALADAITGGDSTAAGRLAIGQWIPIAVLAVAAVISNRQQIAVGLIFSSAIACVSLAVGAVAFLGLAPVSANSRRNWGMMVPAGLLAFLAGLRGSISLFNAGVLAIQGICVLLLWNDRPDPATAADPLPVARPGRGVGFRSAQFVLALLVSGIGAWLALHGIDKMAAGSEFASAGLLTATLLSPLLVLPIIGTGTELSHHNESGVAVTAQIGVAMLNATALLPIVVATSYLRQLVLNHFSFAFDFTPVPFPLAVWRVDVVAFIALGLFLLPVAIGRWSISKMQGLALMCGYVVYLALAILIGMQRI
jgi:Ca2+/Na+ antiporter